MGSESLAARLAFPSRCISRAEDVPPRGDVEVAVGHVLVGVASAVVQAVGAEVALAAAARQAEAAVKVSKRLLAAGAVKAEDMLDDVQAVLADAVVKTVLLSQQLPPQCLEPLLKQSLLLLVDAALGHLRGRLAKESKGSIVVQPPGHAAICQQRPPRGDAHSANHPCLVDGKVWSKLWGDLARQLLSEAVAAEEVIGVGWAERALIAPVLEEAVLARQLHCRGHMLSQRLLNL